MGTRFSDINPELEVYIKPQFYEDGSLKTSREVNEHLLNHIVSIETDERSYDSAVKEYEDLELDDKVIKMNLKYFSRNYGEFCDGSKLRVNDEEYYFKFTSNLSIARDSGVKKMAPDQKLFSLINLVDRSSTEKPTISLFLNEKKIPDYEIKVYLDEGKTDILFPIRYLKYTFDGNGDKVYETASIYLEKRIYPKYQYVSRYFKNMKTDSISFNLADDEYKNVKINTDNPVTVLLYKNGVLMLGTRQVIVDNKMVNIYSNEFSQNDNIEVIIDSDIKYSNRVVRNKSKICLFNLHEDDSQEYKFDYLYGAIPKRNCYFYINGRRISNNKINQVGRMNFSFYEKETDTYDCTIMYTDREYIKESERYIYGDDYYLSNILGVQNVSKLLIGESVNPYIDNLSIDFHKIMNKNSERYKIGYSKRIRESINKYNINEAVTKELLNHSNHLIRDFLNLYGKKELFLDLNIASLETKKEKYTFTVETDMNAKESSTMKFYYIVTVNGRHVKDTEISVEKSYKSNYISIKGTSLNVGVNKIHIREFKFDSGTESNIEFKIANTSDILLIGEEHFYKIPKLNSVKEISDLICLEYTEDDPKVFYDPFYSEKIGWKRKRDVSFQINDIDNSISIIFDTLPKSSKFAIYSKRFCMKFTTTVTKKIEDMVDLMIPIRSASVDRIPIIPNGGFTIFLNDKILFNGIDYVFRHPGNYSKIAYTTLGLKRRTKPGDIITVYFNNVKNEIIGKSNDVISKEGVVHNKYGLIYFGKLEYPYSPRYIDLYINGKFIHPEEIDILSDKLIRVGGIVNPMFDIFAETSFGVDPIKLKNFFKYTPSEFEEIISNWFTDFDFSKNVDPTEESLGNVIYSSFDESVDSYDKVQNPPSTDINKQVPKRYNLLENAYLIWLKSNKVKTIINSKNINKEIVEYFRFYTEDSKISDRQDVIISSKYTKIFNDLTLSNKKYSYNNKERLRRLIHFAKYFSIGTRDMFKKFRDYYPISNVHYLRDLPETINSKSLIDKRGKDIILGGRLSKIYKKHDNT